MNDQESQHIPETPTNPEPTSCASCDEYLSGWKRAQADYANLKKETDQRVREASSYATRKMMEQLLPAIDQLESAVMFAPSTDQVTGDAKARIDAWIAGVVATKSTWESALAGLGLARVSVEGIFDPTIHEAAGQESDPSKPDQAILRVFRSGWMLNGHLLRPATVIINQQTS